MQANQEKQNLMISYLVSQKTLENVTKGQKISAVEVIVEEEMSGDQI
jgi:hypothetical protein